MARVLNVNLPGNQLVIALIKEGRPRIIISEEGRPITPFVVGYTEKGQLLIGEKSNKIPVEDISFKKRVRDFQIRS